MHGQSRTKVSIAPLSTSASSSSSSSSQNSLSIDESILASHLLCPILHERMRDPVIAADGHTYEREAISIWIEKRGGRAISPMTGECLAHLELQENILVKQLIVAYKDSKPQRQQRALREEDILLAIKLREEELLMVLEKQEKRLKSVEKERDKIKKKLAPVSTEIERLKEENEKLRGLQKSPENPYSSRLKPKILLIEENLLLSQKNYFATLIQIFYYRLALRKFMRQNWLHIEKEKIYQEQKREIEQFKKEESTLEKEVVALSSQKKWVEVAKLSQRAETAKQQHKQRLEQLQQLLAELYQDISEKRKIITRLGNRFYETINTKNQFLEVILKQAQEQEHQANLELSEYISQRESAIKIRNISRGLFFSSIPIIPVSKKGQTVLKTNHCLLAAISQLELQNQLTEACYDADFDKVRDLIETKGADPFIPDKDGLQPMAAAIWGLSLKVMDYLETKAPLSLIDWISIAESLQNKYGRVIPRAPKESQELVFFPPPYSNGPFSLPPVGKTLTTSIILEDAAWAWSPREKRKMSDEAIKKRGCQAPLDLNQQYNQILNHESSLRSQYPSPYDINSRNNQIRKDKVRVIDQFIPWFNGLREVMVSRLKNKGLAISEENKLIIESQTSYSSKPAGLH